MKGLIKISLPLMLALFLITSCNKEGAKDNQQTKAITLAEVQNVANPYDQQGVMYNEFLSIMAKDSGKKSGEKRGWDVSKLAEFNGDIGGWDVGQIAQLSDNNDIGGWDVGQVINAGMDYYKSKGKDAGEAAASNLSLQLEAFSGMNISDYNDCWYHPEWCKDVINPVEMLNSSNGGTPHDRIIKYIKAVREQEAVLLENDKISPAEKEGLLVCYSIARHAAGFWYNELRKNEPTGKFVMNIIHLSTLGASTAVISADTKEVGVGTAILCAYIAINGFN